MTQEEKDLLIKDLCARLPYSIQVYYRIGTNELKGTLTTIYPLDNAICVQIRGYIVRGIECIKPYLRPMSSMTEEEKQMMDNLWKDNNKLVFADPDEIRRYRFYDISVVDFLNSCHFDYRGLIEKGLAIEAPEDMYNTKTE